MTDTPTTIARWTSLLLFLLLLPICALAVPPDKATVGVFPVFEMGDSKLGSTFAQHLTTMIFRQLQDSGCGAELLNPGGLYSGNADSETLDYARSSNVTVALITTLLSTQMPEKGDFLIRVDAKLVNVGTGAEMASWQSTAPVSRHEFATQMGNTYGRETVTRLPGGGTAIALADASGSSSHPFDKTPLGKTAQKIAEDIRSQVSHNVPGGSAAVPTPNSGQSCKITFRVSYVAKHTSSKSYDIVVNGKDETLDIVDGKVPLTLNPGVLLIQLSVHDSPYKMPKQDVYQANTRLACSPDQQILVLELDNVGEGSLKWAQN
jgi:hypothetical protein